MRISRLRVETVYTGMKVLPLDVDLQYAPSSGTSKVLKEFTESLEKKVAAAHLRIAQAKARSGTSKDS